MEDHIEELESLRARLVSRAYLFDDSSSYVAGVDAVLSVLSEDEATPAVARDEVALGTRSPELAFLSS